MSQGMTKFLIVVIMQVLTVFWFVVDKILMATLLLLRLSDAAKRVKWRKPQRIDSGEYPETESVTLACDDHGNAFAMSDQRDNICARRFTEATGWGAAEVIDVMDATNEVTSTSRGTRRYPYISCDIQGNALAAWHEELGYNEDIGLWAETWINRYTTSNGWSKAERFAHTPGEKCPVNIVGDAQGRAMAVWFHNSNGHSMILCKRYVPETGWSEATTVTEGDRLIHTLKLIGDRQGRYFIFWDWQEDKSGTGKYTYEGVVPVYACYYSTGNGWSVASKIAEDVLYDKVDRFVPAVDDHGNVIVVWAHQVYMPGNDRADIWAVRYDAITGWDKARVIEPGIECRSGNQSNSTRPRIAFDAAGNAIVVWQQDRDHQNGGIWSNRYTVNVGWGEAMPITRSNYDQAWPQIITTATGNAIAVWTQRSGIGASIYTPGEGWSAPERIHSDSRGMLGYAPRMTIDASGIVTVAWYHEDTFFGSIGAKMYIPGKGWGAATTIARVAPTYPQSPHLAINSNGIVHIIWQQRDSKTNKVYFWTSHRVPTP